MKACKFGDPCCECQDGEACRYVAAAGKPAWDVSPLFVDRLIDLHKTALESQMTSMSRIHADSRSSMQAQINAANAEAARLRADLAAVSARIAAMRGYADKLAACDPRTKWRGTDVARHLNTILKEGTDE